MDTLDKLPERVRRGLLEFLDGIPVEKYSDQWQAIQVAVSMVTAPRSFKQNVHVFLYSRESAHEEGYFNDHQMSVRIWPHILQMKRSYREWSSWAGLTENDLFRYTFPGGKHDVNEFEELMSDTGGLFGECYSDDYSDPSGRCYCFENFSIDTNALVHPSHNTP